MPLYHEHAATGITNALKLAIPYLIGPASIGGDEQMLFVRIERFS